MMGIFKMGGHNTRSGADHVKVWLPKAKRGATSIVSDNPEVARPKAKDGDTRKRRAAPNQ